MIHPFNVFRCVNLKSGKINRMKPLSQNGILIFELHLVFYWGTVLSDPWASQLLRYFRHSHSHKKHSPLTYTNRDDAIYARSHLDLASQICYPCDFLAFRIKGRRFLMTRTAMNTRYHAGYRNSLQVFETPSGHIFLHSCTESVMNGITEANRRSAKGKMVWEAIQVWIDLQRHCLLPYRAAHYTCLYWIESRKG